MNHQYIPMHQARASAWRLLLLEGLFACTLVAAPWVAIADDADDKGTAIPVGQPAPDFKAGTFDGRKIELSDFRGKVLVVNFWATWCQPCRKELPLLDAYYAAQKKAGLEVVAIATESSVPPAKLKPLADAVRFPLVKWLDGPYNSAKLVPTNYVIDRKGVVRYAEAGAFDLDKLNEILVPLLRERAE